jgi:hypothetical protein
MFARAPGRVPRLALTEVVLIALLFAGMLGIGMSSLTHAHAAPGGVVYDSIPSPTDGNYPSQPFQAQQASEFGDKVTMTSPGALEKVKVLMSSWACQSGNAPVCSTTPGATFSHPITLKIYAPGAGPSGVGALLFQKTQTFNIAYRPSADGGVNCPSAPNAWYSVADNACYNGFATPIEFNLASTPQPSYPATIIWSVSYNTQSYGSSPIGSDGPYNSLNVALNDASGPSVGTDVDPNGAFWNTQTAAWYCDGGANGTGTFREDPGCWAPYVPAVQLTQLSLPTISIGNVNPTEGNAGGTTVNVPVTLSHPYPSPVTVHYATSVGGSAVAATRATAGADYTTKSGTLTIPANSTSGTIQVSVVGDTKLEQNETFLVNLSSPTNATLTMAQSSVVTIRNDELPQVLVKGPGSALPEGGTASFSITLKQPYYTTLNLNAATVGNTAASPGDYTAVNQTVVFPSQDVGPKTVNVVTKTDGLTEAVEAFYLRATGGQALAQDQAKIKSNKT